MIVKHPFCSIACVVTFHSEGYLAHKTLLSINQCRRFYEKETQKRCQIVAVIDNGTKLTQAVVRGFREFTESDFVIETNFGDPSSARNFGIKSATSQYIAIMDGDDLYSVSYLKVMADVCFRSENQIVHPAYIVNFGQVNYCWKVASSEFDYSLEGYEFFERNLYPSCVLAQKETFERNPYVPLKPGFGLEDWLWNANALAMGFKHVVAEQAVLYYRRKSSGSRNAYDEKNNVITFPQKLFSKWCG